MDGSPPEHEQHPVFRRNSSFGSSSSIPFSWEHLPEIPKTPTNPKTNPNPLLPLPSALRPNSSDDSVHRKILPDERFLVDPFAVALAECAKEHYSSEGGDELEVAKAAAMRPRRAPTPVIGDRFEIVDFYGSCKATCSVVDSTVCILRSGRFGSYGRLNRRAG